MRRLPAESATTVRTGEASGKSQRAHFGKEVKWTRNEGKHKVTASYYTTIKMNDPAASGRGIKKKESIY
jgi:hypothetical protein